MNQNLLGRTMLSLITVMGILLLSLYDVSQRGQITTYYDLFCHQLFSQICILLCILIICRNFKILDKNTVTAKGMKIGLVLGIPLVLFNLINILRIIVPNLGIIDINMALFVIILLYALAVGFTEEILYRAVLFKIILEKLGKKSVFKSMMISSIIFGLLHMLNIATYSLAAVLLQATYAVAIGLLLNTIYVISGNLMSIAVIHGLFDFLSNISFSLFDLTYAPPSLSSDVTVAAGLLLYVIIYNIILFERYPEKSWKYIEEGK